jgi:hypothetical protein
MVAHSPLKMFFSIVAILIVAATASLPFSHAGQVRKDVLNLTIVEIERGNYHAWRRANSWKAQLTSEEKRMIGNACRKYASINTSLRLTNSAWLPTKSDFQEKIAQFNQFLGLIDQQAGDLAHRIMCCPAFHNNSVYQFDGMLHEW